MLGVLSMLCCGEVCSFATGDIQLRGNLIASVLILAEKNKGECDAEQMSDAMALFAIM